MTSPGPQRCRRCLLPAAVPGLTFDETSLCSICQVTPSQEELAGIRAQIRRDVEGIIEAHRGARPYECVVAFSGGKDSSYTLKLLTETYGLRCIAITIENGSIEMRSFAKSPRHAHCFFEWIYFANVASTAMAARWTAGG